MELHDTNNCSSCQDPARSASLVGRCLRPLSEVRPPMIAVPDQPSAGDRLLSESLPHGVDRLGDAIGPVWGVEQRELLDIGQVDGGQADQAHRAIASKAPCAAG